MNLKTTLLTTTAILLAATAFAAPAQAATIPPIQPRNPCDNMISPDPEVQQIIYQCRHADDQLPYYEGQVILLAEATLQTVLGIVDTLPGVDPNNLLPDVCSLQENVVPYALECAAWAIDQLNNIPGSGEIVALVEGLLTQIENEVAALQQWAEDYALVDVAGWYDATAAQASTDLGNLGTWILAQEGYSSTVQAWANGVAGQAVGNLGGEVTYATTTAGTAAADSIALAFYADCRLLSPSGCGDVPAPHVPGNPPTLLTPGNPPLPTIPPTPAVPIPPPTPGMPPV
jgi:hypothetical protein